MEAITDNIKVYSEIDPNFDNSQLSSYRLVMKVGSSYLTTCVVEISTGKLLCAEQFSYSNATNDQALIVRLQNIKSNHSYLNATFWGEIVVLINNSFFTVIPEPLFDAEATLSLLEQNFSQLPASSTCFHTLLEEFKYSVPFATGNELVGWFKSEYINDENNTSLSFHHTAAAFLEGLATLTPLSGNTINLFVDDTLAYFCSIEGSKLNFINSFEYAGSATNLLYYAISVLKGLKMHAVDTTLKVWGNLKQESEHIKLLEKNFKAAVLGDKPKGIEMAVALSSNLPEHENMDIYTAGIRLH